MSVARTTVAIAVGAGLGVYLLAETVLPGEVPAVTVALLVGLVLGAIVSPDVDAATGLVQRVLPLAIVLIGLRISLGQIAELGLETLALTVLALGTGLAVALGVARILGVPRRLATLLALGTAICGNTAIISAAPVIRARRDEIAYAVATITLFGTLAVLVFPPLGHALGLGETQFGIWAGLGVNDTAQVVATGYAYSDPSGEIATIVKLVRNVFLGPILIGVALVSPDARDGERPAFRAPWFVWGFLAAAAIASLGLLPDRAVAETSRVATALVIVVMVAVGLATRLGALRTVGMRPLIVGFVAMTCLSGLVLTLVRLGVGS